MKKFDENESEMETVAYILKWFNVDIDIEDAICERICTAVRKQFSDTLKSIEIG